MDDTDLSKDLEAEDNRARWLRADLVAPWWEIAAVLIVMIGPFTGRSAWMALHGSSSQYVNLLMSNSRLIGNGIFEAALLALMIGFLHRRGWNLSDFKIRPSWKSSLEGFLLFIAVTIGNSVTVTGLLMLIFVLQTSYSQFLPFLVANSPHIAHHSIEIGWTVLVVSMILNAFFEEMTCMGYAFNQFAAKRGPRFALLLTVLLRMSCHTYQGPIHMLGIGVVFFLFGLWYRRTGNLWTLIFAHSLLDLGSMSFVKVLFG